MEQNFTVSKILQDLLYVRKRMRTESSDEIKGHAVLSKIIDYLRWCDEQDKNNNTEESK